MNEKKRELLMELKEVDTKLEKEKLKRDLILIILSSIFCGMILYSIGHPFENFYGILILVIVSLIIGSALYFFSVNIYIFVTQSFTSIESLSSLLKNLEEQVREIDFPTIDDSFETDNENL